MSAYEAFMRNRIKVDGRTGQLGDKVIVRRAGDAKLEITPNIPFSKRYLK